MGFGRSFGNLKPLQFCLDRLSFWDEDERFYFGLSHAAERCLFVHGKEVMRKGVKMFSSRFTSNGLVLMQAALHAYYAQIPTLVASLIGWRERLRAASSAFLQQRFSEIAKRDPY